MFPFTFRFVWKTHIPAEEFIDSDITFLCHITCSNVSRSLSLKPPEKSLKLQIAEDCDSETVKKKIKDPACQLLLRRMSKKKKASGLEV